MIGKSSFDQMDELINEQVIKLEDLRQRVAALDESVKFTKDEYLEVLDAYIGTEKLLRETRQLCREFAGL